MDYEKNKEAIKIVRQMVADGQIAEDIAAKYFPELTEEWSEEDEEIRKSIIDRIERRRMSSIGSESAICENQIAWLKSLRPQKQWKPSSQQICALDYVIKEYESTNISLYKESIKQLIFLREQLKAL